MLLKWLLEGVAQSHFNAMDVNEGWRAPMYIFVVESHFIVHKIKNIAYKAQKPWHFIFLRFPHPVPGLTNRESRTKDIREIRDLSGPIETRERGVDGPAGPNGVSGLFGISQGGKDPCMARTAIEDGTMNEGLKRATYSMYVPFGWDRTTWTLTECGPCSLEEDLHPSALLGLPQELQSSALPMLSIAAPWRSGSRLSSSLLHRLRPTTWLWRECWSWTESPSSFWPWKCVLVSSFFYLMRSWRRLWGETSEYAWRVGLSYNYIQLEILLTSPRMHPDRIINAIRSIPKRVHLRRTNLGLPFTATLPFECKHARETSREFFGNSQRTSFADICSNTGLLDGQLGLMHARCAHSIQVPWPDFRGHSSQKTNISPTHFRNIYSLYINTKFASKFIAAKR